MNKMESTPQPIEPPIELPIDRKKLAVKAFIQSIFMLGIFSLCFFLPAKTIHYWQAWTYIGVFYSMMIFNLIYLTIHDPELLQRRLDRKEERSAQKWFITLGNLFILPLYILPGFDFRFQWTPIPWWMVIFADILFAFSYAWFFWVLKTNSFAARTIKIDKNRQHVITRGPYAIVRHPLYLGAGIMFGITPLCLGSWMGTLCIPFLCIIMAFRILDEEKLLEKELEGYKKYKQKVKYRIFPRIW